MSADGMTDSEWAAEQQVAKEADFYTVLHTNELGEALATAVDTVAMGNRTGRFAMQVMPGTLDGSDFVYGYTGSGRYPITRSMDEVPDELRRVVRRLLALYSEHTGAEANNVLVQRYRATAGIGEHRDNTRDLKVVGGGVILSYNGGYSHRSFFMRDDNMKSLPETLRPGTVVLFEDGERLHGLHKPYSCTKAELAECQERCRDPRVPAHGPPCVFRASRFRCTHPDCLDDCTGHACRCPHWRVNITVRRLAAKRLDEMAPKRRRASSPPLPDQKKVK